MPHIQSLTFGTTLSLGRWAVKLRRIILIWALALGVVVLVGTALMQYWLNTPSRRQPSRTIVPLIDERVLLTAERLSALALTQEEKELAQKALHLADHEVDLNFTSALRQATLYPPSLPAAVQPLIARVDTLDDRIKAEQKEVARLKQRLATASEKQKPSLQAELQLQEAMQEVDQEDLDAAHQELIRAGGDPRSVVQRLIEEHDIWSRARSTGAAPAPPKTEQKPESRTIVVQFRAWRQLSITEQTLKSARVEIKELTTTLASQRQQQLQPTAAPESQGLQSSPATRGSNVDSSGEILTILKQVAGQQKNLAELDRRAEDVQQLDTVYSQWEVLIQRQRHTHMLTMLQGIFWVVIFLLPVVLANSLVSGLVSRLVPQSRRRHTFRVIARFVIQALGLGLALLVIFGPPSQIATVLALAGAGLTVALKDFIVAFFGWFILMGRNGIRTGDWVEINGTGGEVIEVGLLHTVLLETGNWSDSGHPTGRKVTFVNSFAIEGHYFNFSTTGQWLWDEIDVPIPAGADPYAIAEAVQNDVLEETGNNMRMAEQEWQHSVPAHVSKSFSVAPDVSVRPTSLGVDVIVRYITRADERYETRSRLFFRIVERLRGTRISQARPEADAAKPANELSAIGARKSA